MFKLFAQTTACILLSLLATAETDSLIILHTNDMHDHLRPGYDGVGGMAYLATYIRQQKTRHANTLVLDAGDVMEKGDLVAFKAKSTLMYEAMGRIGYDAAAPGNHDDTYGFEHLIRCSALAPNTAMLCINWFQNDGSLIFPASKIFDVDGVRVGVIGMIRPRDSNSLDLEASARAIASEAQRLEPECHLLVLTCHAGTKDCIAIAKIAPQIDIFVSGHTHQALSKPMSIPNSSALIVQAGHSTRNVGRLEIEIDLANEEFRRVDYQLVEMNHDSIEPDAELEQWIVKQEFDIAPEAIEPIGIAPQKVRFPDLSRIGAVALRETTDADIAFCHTGQIIRAELAAGPYDRNALFRTGGHRGYVIYETRLNGSDIDAYLNGLARNSWGQTAWSGFRAARDPKTKRFNTNLEPDRSYRVIMPRKEWDTRFLRYFERGHEPKSEEEAQRIKSFSARPIETSFTEAIIEYIRQFRLESTDLREIAAKNAENSTLLD